MNSLRPVCVGSLTFFFSSIIGFNGTALACMGGHFSAKLSEVGLQGGMVASQQDITVAYTVTIAGEKFEFDQQSKSWCIVKQSGSRFCDLEKNPRTIGSQFERIYPAQMLYARQKGKFLEIAVGLSPLTQGEDSDGQFRGNKLRIYNVYADDLGTPRHASTNFYMADANGDAVSDAVITEVLSNIIPSERDENGDVSVIGAVTKGLSFPAPYKGSLARNSFGCEGEKTFSKTQVIRDTEKLPTRRRSVGVGQ